MLASRLRQTATMLLESAIRIAPRESRDWGRAMRSELNQVEDNRTAAMWAMGGAGVLAKYTIASALIPGRRGQGLAPDGWLFSRRLSLRRAALFTGIACVLAALVFFAAPPFRQGLRVALQPWYFVFQKTSGDFQPDFAFVINRAETSHDAEGLAFCAVRVENPSESARLAKEAVRLDPNLIWVYAVVGMRHPALPEIGAWADQLERWDSQNALFHLIQAESVRLANLHQGAALLSAEENERAWQNAMLEAFQSSKFDDYLDRVAELNRRVVPRYQFYDPYEVQSREQLDLPSYAFDNAEHFANSLFHSETNLKSKDSHEAGREKYWTVARFGQLIDSQARTDFEHWAGTTLQAMAYRQLEGSSVKEGNESEAALFAYLAAKFEPPKGKRAESPRDSAFGQDTSRRNAAVVEISGLMILVFSGLVVIAASILIASIPQRARPAIQRIRTVATMVVLTGAAGLLFSSATLYLTYRPYWYIFQTAILTGGRSHARDLGDFLTATEMLPGVPPRLYLLLDSLLFSRSPSFLFYFWSGFTLLGVSGLGLILLRHFLGGTRIPALRHSPRVP